MCAQCQPLLQSEEIAEPFIRNQANIYTCYGLRGDKDKFLMALLTGYFDESGIHEGEHLCVVAGFVGNEAQWLAFAADWMEAIKPRQNIHMTQLRWSQHPERIAPLLAKLGPIPHRYNLTPVAVSVRWSDYNTIAKGHVIEQLGNPYIMCANLCIAEVRLNIAKNELVQFLFCRQEGTRKQTMREIRDLAFDEFGLDTRVAAIDYISQVQTVCLDPADYLAFMVRERDIDPNSDKSRMGESIMGSGRVKELGFSQSNLMDGGTITA